MLLLLSILLAIVCAQNCTHDETQEYNCPTFSSAPGDCSTVRKSKGCVTHLQFAYDPFSAAPTICPTFCTDNPNSNRWCMATPLSPSTPTSGFCRPRCATKIKQFFLGTNYNGGGGCPTLTINSFCAQSVINCDSFNITCDWCAWNLTTNTCYKAFNCNNQPF